eukprot:1159669-Pelagomonas_calceolata.AAC.3
MSPLLKLVECVSEEPVTLSHAWFCRLPEKHKQNYYLVLGMLLCLYSSTLSQSCIRESRWSRLHHLMLNLKWNFWFTSLAFLATLQGND